MRLRRDGLTMVEMLFVILISSVVLGMGTHQYSQVSNARAVAGARDAVVMAAHRARSEAVRSGSLVFLEIRSDEVVVVEELSATDALHSVRMSDYDVSLDGAGQWVCYTARGYALPSCTNLSDAATVTFSQGGETAQVKILALGQVRSEK